MQIPTSHKVMARGQAVKRRGGEYTPPVLTTNFTLCICSKRRRSQRIYDLAVNGGG
jgi:hypothetical protein